MLNIKFNLTSSERINYSPSTALCLGEQALLRDAYEEKMVYVAKSNIEHAGDGLFAQNDVPKNKIVAFFNCLKIPSDVDYSKELFAFDEVSFVLISKSVKRLNFRQNCCQQESTQLS